MQLRTIVFTPRPDESFVALPSTKGTYICT